MVHINTQLKVLKWKTKFREDTFALQLWGAGGIETGTNKIQNCIDFSNKLSKLFHSITKSDEMLIYDKSPYIFLVLFRVLLPGLKYRLLSGLGRAPKGRKKKKQDVLMRKKIFNYKANPDAVSRSNSKRCPAPQTLAKTRQFWFLISKLQCAWEAQSIHVE